MAFGPFLAALGLGILKAEARIIARRVLVRAVTAVIAGILLAIAVGLGIAAFTAWLAGEIGTINALLVVAGIMLVLALIVLGVGRLVLSRRRAPPPQPQFPHASVPPAPPPDPEAPPSGSALGSVAVVALVGFLLARQMFRRR